ncbi:helicase-related protein [Pyrofollis japonicus]|uniref:helicase-related protein n=1 Tax=Pyrofollis japonicus TaxID=3060460 RepID=UPI00295BB472|nr:helicase-related protein [Pyrofollis japonicus]BEP17366.1 helicase-related protein [Pyrofollis japonicus]
MLNEAGAGLLYLALSKLLSWHPIYVFSTPATRPYVPYSHQVVVLRDNASRPVVRVLIGDEVGLGKTAQAALTLRLLEARRKAATREGRDEFRALILVPRILVEQWFDELVSRASISHARIYMLRSGEDLDWVEQKGWPPGYYIGSIQLLRLRNYADRLVNVDWDVVVVDEVHNVGVGPSFQSPNKSYQLVFRLTRPPHRSVILLSATPHRGKSRDYIARLMLLVPEIALEDVRQLVSILDNNEFYKKTHGTLVYRRTKELVNELEEREVFRPAHFYAVIINVSREEQQFEKILRGFAERKVSEWGSEIWERGNPKGLIIALLLKRASSSVYAARKTLATLIENFNKRLGEGADVESLRQILSIDFSELSEEPEELLRKALGSAAGLFTRKDIEELASLVSLAAKIEEDGESKLKALVDIIEKHVSEGRRVVVFTEYRDTLEYLYERLKGLSVGGRELRIRCISGAAYGPCSRQNIEIIKSELEAGDLDVVLATDVASEGLNLQHANVLINYDVPWSPVKLEQRIGRIWRLGQRNEVEIYSLFRSASIDYVLVEKLYSKILAIHEATGTSRPIIGAKAELYAEGEFYSIDKLYRGGAPGSSDAVADALEEEGEVGIARAILENNLDAIAKKILERINKLRQEIQEKNIYPSYIEPLTLKKRLEMCLGSPEPPMRIVEKQAKILQRLLGRDEPKDSYDAVKSLRGALAWLLASKKGSTVKHYYRSPALEPGTRLAIIPVAVKSPNGALLYEELVGIMYSSKGRSSYTILVGPMLLDKLVEIAEKGIEYADKARISPLEKNILLLRAQNHVQQCLSISFRRDNLEALWKLIGEKTGKETSIGTRIRVEPLESEIVLIEHGPVGGAPREPRKVSEASEERQGALKEDIAALDELERRQQIERKAIPVVMRYELDHGRVPRDVHEERSYDIESYDPQTGEVLRYIEVKSHCGDKAIVELTEKEYEFAKAHRDKYWLYIVLNMCGDKPKIITIHDPLSKLGFKRLRKRIVEERVETRYIAEVTEIETT